MFIDTGYNEDSVLRLKLECILLYGNSKYGMVGNDTGHEGNIPSYEMKTS